MKIQFFAYIRDYSGCKEGEYPDYADVYALLHGLSELYGPKMRARLLDAGGEQPHPHIIILVNGRHISHLQGIRTPLAPSDTVQVFPVVAGG